MNSMGPNCQWVLPWPNLDGYNRSKTVSEEWGCRGQGLPTFVSYRQHIPVWCQETPKNNSISRLWVSGAILYCKSWESLTTLEAALWAGEEGTGFLEILSRICVTSCRTMENLWDFSIMHIIHSLSRYYQDSWVWRCSKPRRIMSTIPYSYKKVLTKKIKSNTVILNSGFCIWKTIKLHIIYIIFKFFEITIL